MYKKLVVGGTLLVLLTLTVCLCSPALASASTSKAFKCRVIKHGRHAVVVNHGDQRLLVRDHHRYVKVHGVRRYRVVKRHYRYVVLRAVSASAVAVPGNTPISAGTAEPAGLPATASSVQTGYMTSWGNDWQTATRWSASTRSYPQWWMVDLGSCKTVTGVQTDWYNGARRAYRYRVETSLDGFTFISAADRSKNRTRGVTTDAMSAPARYVRVQVLGASISGAWASANEITVYAEATPTPPPTPEPTPSPTPTDTPTPTPTPTVTPSQTPTPTPTVTPSQTPTPTPRVTPSQTPTPTVTPSQTPTPTPTPNPIGVDVTAYGARGDGVTDDRGAVLAAIAAAKGRPVYFPAGTYYLASRLTVPDGSHLAGPSGAGPGSTAWLKGAVVYSSNQAFADLRIGDLNKTGIVNGSGATNTSFTRCQFRGGGGSVAKAPVFFGGGVNSCSRITFTDCDVERNLGDHEVFPGASNWNNVNWVEDVSRVDGAHMEYITFIRCHFGVSNGRTDIARNIGSPRANVELYQYPEGGVVRTGYHDVAFRDCVFEAADMFTLDLPSAIYNGAHTDGYVTVDGCTIYGGGVTKDYWGYAINIEGVNHVTITDCDIYPAWDSCLVILAFDGVDCNNWQITNNRFHLDDFSHGGINARNTEPAIRLEGTAGTFSGNTIRNSTGSYWLFWLGTYYDGNSAGDCDISGNYFQELRTTANSMARIQNATNCTITGNTFQTAASSVPSISYSGANTGTVVKDNLFLHR